MPHAPPAVRIPEQAKVHTGPWGRAALLLVPVAAVVLGYVLLFLLSGHRVANQALLVGGIFLTFVGPSVIFGSAGFDALSTWPVVAVVAFFSCVSAFFYAYNLDLFERVPRVGTWLRRVTSNTRRSLSARPWIRRWAIVGVGFFVLLPLPGSGTLGGALMGRLVGLTPRATFGAVSVAGVLVAAVYGGFGDAIDDLPLPVRIAGGVVFLIGVMLLGRWLVGQGRGAAPHAAK